MKKLNILKHFQQHLGQVRFWCVCVQAILNQKFLTRLVGGSGKVKIWFRTGHGSRTPEMDSNQSGAVGGDHSGSISGVLDPFRGF